MKTPMTLEEAQKYRYGTWAGSPDGNGFHSGYCIKEVWNGCMVGVRSHQCGRHNGYGPGGLYCWQHAKEFENG